MSSFARHYTHTFANPNTRNAVSIAQLIKALKSKTALNYWPQLHTLISNTH